MRSIRKRDTSPELRVRRSLHAAGLRFRLHRKDLPGSPDIILPRHGTAILVHGCFWHQHPDCRLARRPKANLGYWEPKLARNIARDVRVQEELEALGWRVLVIWECQTRDPSALARLVEMIRSPKTPPAAPPALPSAPPP